MSRTDINEKISNNTR